MVLYLQVCIELYEIVLFNLNLIYYCLFNSMQQVFPPLMYYWRSPASHYLPFTHQSKIIPIYYQRLSLTHTHPFQTNTPPIQHPYRTHTTHLTTITYSTDI